MSEDVEDRIYRLVSTRVQIPTESLSSETTFEEIHIDSLDRLNLLFDIEAEFDIHIDDEQAIPVNNLGALVEGVKRLVAAKADPSPVP